MKNPIKRFSILILFAITTYACYSTSSLNSTLAMDPDFNKSEQNHENANPLASNSNNATDDQIAEKLQTSFDDLTTNFIKLKGTVNDFPHIEQFDTLRNEFDQIFDKFLSRSISKDQKSNAKAYIKNYGLQNIQDKLSEDSKIYKNIKEKISAAIKQNNDAVSTINKLIDLLKQLLDDPSDETLNSIFTTLETLSSLKLNDNNIDSIQDSFTEINNAFEKILKNDMVNRLNNKYTKVKDSFKNIIYNKINLDILKEYISLAKNFLVQSKSNEHTDEYENTPSGLINKLRELLDQIIKNPTQNEIYSDVLRILDKISTLELNLELNKEDIKSLNWIILTRYQDLYGLITSKCDENKTNETLKKLFKNFTSDHLTFDTYTMANEELDYDFIKQHVENIKKYAYQLYNFNKNNTIASDNTYSDTPITNWFYSQETLSNLQNLLNNLLNQPSINIYKNISELLTDLAKSKLTEADLKTLSHIFSITYEKLSSSVKKYISNNKRNEFLNNLANEITRAKVYCEEYFESLKGKTPNLDTLRKNLDSIKKLSYEFNNFKANIPESTNDVASETITELDKLLMSMLGDQQPYRVLQSIEEKLDKLAGLNLSSENVKDLYYKFLVAYDYLVDKIEQHKDFRTNKKLQELAQKAESLYKDFRQSKQNSTSKLDWKFLRSHLKTLVDVTTEFKNLTLPANLTKPATDFKNLTLPANLTKPATEFKNLTLPANLTKPATEFENLTKTPEPKILIIENDNDLKNSNDISFEWDESNDNDDVTDQLKELEDSLNNLLAEPNDNNLKRANNELNKLKNLNITKEKIPSLHDIFKDAYQNLISVTNNVFEQNKNKKANDIKNSKKELDNYFKQLNNQKFDFSFLEKHVTSIKNFAHNLHEYNSDSYEKFMANFSKAIYYTRQENLVNSLKQLLNCPNDNNLNNAEQNLDRILELPRSIANTCSIQQNFEDIYYDLINKIDGLLENIEDEKARVYLNSLKSEIDDTIYDLEEKSFNKENIKLIKDYALAVNNYDPCSHYEQLNNFHESLKKLSEEPNDNNLNNSLTILKELNKLILSSEDISSIQQSFVDIYNMLINRMQNLSKDPKYKSVSQSFSPICSHINQTKENLNKYFEELNAVEDFEPSLTPLQENIKLIQQYVINFNNTMLRATATTDTNSDKKAEEPKTNINNLDIDDLFNYINDESSNNKKKKKKKKKKNKQETEQEKLKKQEIQDNFKQNKYSASDIIDNEDIFNVFFEDFKNDTNQINAKNKEGCSHKWLPYLSDKFLDEHNVPQEEKTRFIERRNRTNIFNKITKHIDTSDIPVDENKIVENNSNENEIIENNSNENKIIENNSDENKIIENNSNENEIVENNSDENKIKTKKKTRKKQNRK